MTARGAGNGTPGGRRSRPRSDSPDGGQGLGRGGGGRGAGAGRGMGAGGARLRRRDGSGRLGAAGAVGTTAVSSLAQTAAPVAGPSRTSLITGTDARIVARLTDADACIGCGICVDVCPRSAIELDDLPTIDEESCGGCDECVEACPRGALTLVAG